MFTVIIPSRFNSTRLPGKPLAMINDKPMIQHVVEQAKKSDADNVIVATDDQRIFDVVKAMGCEVCMTAVDHESGTDRIQEVSKLYGLADDAIVVNVQGDEPLIPPELINQVAKNLFNNKSASAATLSERIHLKDDFENPNIVKVVNDTKGYALYFSRSMIPFFRDSDKLTNNLMLNDDNRFGNDRIEYFPQRHIGIYAYRVSLLNQFIQWPVSNIESIESLEQLRILFNGKKIHIEQSELAVPGGIDTPEDLERIRQYLSAKAVL